MFADRIVAAMNRKRSFLVVGIDPSLEQLPRRLLVEAEQAGGSELEVAERALTRFGVELVEATAEYAVAVKPQLAYFERYGSYGLRAFETIAREAKAAGLLVIADGKRNDIGSTAEAYAAAYLEDGPFAVDALTINPYLGVDGVEPFLKRCRENGRGVFILVKTSNPSSGQFQDALTGNEPLYARVADAVEAWNSTVGSSDFGYAGAVVGATYPEQLEELRRRMPRSLFLVPGYGAQGGTADDVVPAFNTEGYGGLINSSRGIMYAFKKDETLSISAAQAQAAKAARDAINQALACEGKLPVAFGGQS